jgi:hypothetical protein
MGQTYHRLDVRLKRPGVGSSVLRASRLDFLSPWTGAAGGKEAK